MGMFISLLYLLQEIYQTLQLDQKFIKNLKNFPNKLTAGNERFGLSFFITQIHEDSRSAFHLSQPRIVIYSTFQHYNSFTQHCKIHNYFLLKKIYQTLEVGYTLCHLFTLFFGNNWHHSFLKTTNPTKWIFVLVILSNN